MSSCAALLNKKENRSSALEHGKLYKPAASLKGAWHRQRLPQIVVLFYGFLQVMA